MSTKLLDGYTIPHSFKVEKSVIGALLVDNNTVDEVQNVIKSADVFFDAAHRVIYEAITQLYNVNQPIDLITVSAQLTKMEKLDVAGGDFGLIGLTQGVASGAHSEYHSRILLQFWMKREYIKTATEVLSLCRRESVDVFDIEKYIETKVDSVKDATGSGSRQLTMEKAVDQVVQRVEKLTGMDEGEITGVPTGFEKVDRLTGGWQNTDLIIIAARPGMGKSAICSRTILACAHNNMPVGVVSLEMSTVQLVTRLMSNDSNFHLNQLFRTGFPEHKVKEYMPKLISLKGKMQGYPVYFEDTPAMDIRIIKAVARRWHRQHGIKILIIDYLQLIKDATKANNREQEISSISQQLKAIAKELNIPVIALSQLSRAVETRGGDKKPQLSDLRESGAIEQDADLISFIWRPEYYGFEVPHEMQSIGANTELSIAKHRNGSLDRLGIWFDSNKTKFMDQSPNFNDYA